MENLLNAIQTVGYPINSNVRITPLNLYDEQTLSATIGENRFFTSESLGTFTRNKKFPLSGNEIAFIDNIAVRLMGTGALSLTAANMGLFTKTCLQVLIDGRERLKIPLIECLSAPMGFELGTTTTIVVAENVGRSKKIRLPLIINSQSNVEVKIITDADYNALGVVRVELDGLLYSKLSPFDYNPSAGKGIERLSYTMFDTAAVVAAGQNINLFTTADKGQSLFSKVFPLAASETFDIENIEVAFPVNIGTAATTFQAVQALAKESRLKVNIKGVDFLELAGKDLVTVLFQNAVAGTFKHSDGTITTNLINNKIVYAGITLPVAITVPAKAQVRVSLDTNAITNVSTSGFMNVMLKGTLQRLVQ